MSCILPLPGTKLTIPTYHFHSRPMVLEAVLDIFLLSQDLKKDVSEEDQLEQFDPEDTGFQASFSKLGASEPAARDPVANVADPKAFLSEQLSLASQRNPGKVCELLADFCFGR